MRSRGSVSGVTMAGGVVSFTEQQQVSILTTGPLPALLLSLHHPHFGPCPPTSHDHPLLSAASPGRMTSGKPSLRVSARARLNTAWFSRLICSSSPRSSCREMMSPGGLGGGGQATKKEEQRSIYRTLVRGWRRRRARGGTTIWNYATRQRKCRQ